MLTRHAEMSVRALLIREVALAILGAVYGFLITPLVQMSNRTDAGFKFFQAFCTFMFSMPWATTTLAAYTMAYFQCRQFMGEAPEPVISEIRGPEFRNRIPGFSAASKVWLAMTFATLLIAVYTYRGTQFFVAFSTSEQLVKAGEGGRISRMKELLAAGADPNALSRGWSPLTRSVLWGQVQAVEVLLAAGADVNSYERHIGSALYLAVAARRPALVRKLLDRGADPNAAPVWGHTPLMRAAMQGDLDVARRLLEHGADATRRSPWGERASTFARNEGHLELAELLERAEKR
jgi:hypothetical protein